MYVLIPCVSQSGAVVVVIVDFGSSYSYVLEGIPWRSPFAPLRQVSFAARGNPGDDASETYNQELPVNTPSTASISTFLVYSRVFGVFFFLLSFYGK